MVVLGDNGGIPYDPGPLVAGQSLVQFDGSGFPHRFLPGTGIQPQANQTFESINGTAILDGCGQVNYAFASNADNVTIRGLEMRNFIPIYQKAVVSTHNHFASEPMAPADEGLNWIIEDNWIHSSTGVGISHSSNSQVRRNRLSHMGQMAVTSKGGSNGIFEENVVDHSMLDRHSSVEEAGGSKWKFTTNFQVRSNVFFSNYGYGIWFDIDNDGATIEENLVEGHERSGIFWEISFNAQINRNTIRRAGIGYNGWMYGAAIISASSTFVTVVDNYAEESVNGYAVINQTNRGPGGQINITPQGQFFNNVAVDSGQSGFNHDPGTPIPNTVWQNNTYTDICVGTASCGFQDPNGGVPFRMAIPGSTYNTATWAQWQASGFDQSGTATGCTL